MKNCHLYVPFALLLLAVLGCSFITDRATKGILGDDFNRTGQLWPDVPQMDGLTVSDADMPLPIKFVMRTVLNNVWRTSKEGEDKNPTKGDWMVFTTTSKPADVENFYTNEKMSGFGWEKGKGTSCVDGKDKGLDGVLCVFEKTADKKETGLAIISKRDDSGPQTYVFFLRVERDVTPEQKQSANH